MTFEEFRAHDQNRLELKQILATPILAKAMVTVLDHISLLKRAQDEAPEVVSVRMLEYRTGAEDFTRFLQDLTQPSAVPVSTIPATYGEDDAFAKLEALTNAPKT